MSAEKPLGGTWAISGNDGSLPMGVLNSLVDLLSTNAQIAELMEGGAVFTSEFNRYPLIINPSCEPPYAQYLMGGKAVVELSFFSQSLAPPQHLNTE